MRHIQSNLEELMKKNSLTVADLAKKVGMDYKQISNYTNGVYFPNLASAIRIADFFNCSLDYLCDLSSEETPKKYNKPDYLFYPRYKTLLEDRQITHYKLAKNTGINVNNLRLWKAGKIPKLSTLLIIADYIGTSIDFLIGRTQKTN